MAKVTHRLILAQTAGTSTNKKGVTYIMLVLPLFLAVGGCTGSCKTVQLSMGAVEGGDNVDGGVHFKGLPFAAPPIGDLR